MISGRPDSSRRFSLSRLMLAAALVVSAAAQTPAPAAKAPARPRLPFTSAVRVGDTNYLAGLGSRDPKLGGHPEGFEAQVRQLMVNLQALLKRNGLDFGDVVHAHAYSTYAGRFDEFDRIYREYFPGVPPALTSIGVRRLPATEVEISFIASHRPHSEVIVPGAAPHPNRISFATKDGDYLYISGTDSRDLKSGQLPSGDFSTHARRCLENVGAALKAGGMSYRDAVKVEVYLTDLKQLDAFNALYRSFFSEDPPSRTTVGVTELPKGAPVLMNLVAAPGKKVVQPAGIPRNPDLSPAIRVGDRLFLSGGLAKKSGAVGAQVREVMDELGRILNAAGMNFANVVEGKVYVANMEDYAAMNEAYGSYFTTSFASRACIQTGALPANSKIEITLVADASPRR